MSMNNPTREQYVAIVAALLRAIPVGGVLPYEEISTALGHDITRDRYILSKARKEVETSTGHMLETVRGQGVQKLETSRLSGIGLSALRKVRRTAGRASSRIQRIRANDLTRSQAMHLTAQAAQLGVIAQLADGRKTQKLHNFVAANQGQVLPVGDIFHHLTRTEKAA